jgi:nitrite reductase (NO-forming)
VLLLIGYGMYGAIIVDPSEPLPRADVSYVLVQSEWYTAQVEGTLMTGDYDKMMSVRPDEVVFNGVAFQYNENPLTAKAGQRVRLYVINAGPNLASAFHIIGGMFAAVYPDADAKMRSAEFPLTRSRRAKAWCSTRSSPSRGSIDRQS